MVAAAMIELWRGGFLESSHSGHAVVCDAAGNIVEAWGDAEALIFPRSSCKMIQALPLLESGAAVQFALTDPQLALACASHLGAAIHTDRVASWLQDLGLSDSDLRCGAHLPYDSGTRDKMVCAQVEPCQIHNNCSGKHAGFLTLARHLQAGPEYVEIDHPVQRLVRTAFEEVTGCTSPGYGIDGCSAPNFLTSVHGLARAMAFFAKADPEGDSRDRAAARLTRAMTAYPELLSGEGRASTDLMRAMGGKVAIKTGAEGVFTAILPEKKLGIALKIVDGTTRASEAAIAALLVRHGVLDGDHPAAKRSINTPQRNCRGIVAGELRLAAGFCSDPSGQGVRPNTFARSA